MIKYYIVAIVLSGFVSSCATPGEAENKEEDDINQSDLPEKAENLVIKLNEGGGMLPIWYKTYISKDSAYWLYDRYGYETIVRWVPSKGELDELYDKLKSDKFDKIKSDCEGQVYDRGGISIEIEVNSKEYKINNSGNCFIQEKYLESYNSVLGAIVSYEQRKVKEQFIQIPLEVSNSLINSGYDVEIEINNGRSSFIPSFDTLVYNGNFYPGPNEFIIKLNYKDSTNYYGSPENYVYEQMFETIDGESKRILIDWKGNQVLINVEN